MDASIISAGSSVSQGETVRIRVRTGKNTRLDNSYPDNDLRCFVEGSELLVHALCAPWIAITCSWGAAWANGNASIASRFD